MSFFSFFGGSNLITTQSDCSIAEIYPMGITKNIFTRSDVINVYKKILTDTIERTHSLPDFVQNVLWDNCVQSEASQGLVSLLAHSMYHMSDLYLVFDKAVGVLRKATPSEMSKIQADYKDGGESKVGTFASFKNYHRTEMLLIYSDLEYCVTASLYKSLNLSKAVQVKISELRTSVALNDSEIARAQAKGIGEALSQGLDVIMDIKDDIVTAKVDTDPTEKAITFLDAKRAFILGMPMSYISGEQTTGIGSTGEGDMRAVERGLKQYFVSIVRPIILSVFAIDTEFKSQDFKQVSASSEIMKTFDLVSDDYLSKESKQDILARMFDLDPDEERKLIEEEAASAPPEPAPQVVVAPIVKPNGQAKVQ